MKLKNKNSFAVLFYCRIKKFIKHKIIREKPLCSIEEINLTKKTIIIHCRSIDAPIKLMLDEVINDPAILANLSSKQASWIGYYYGKYYRELLREENNCSNIFNFTIDESLEKCNIVMLNRHGNLIYSSRVDNITHTISPINALRSENIIMQFTPIQACYIGILAGTYNLKKCNQKTFSPLSKAQLKVIK